MLERLQAGGAQVAEIVAESLVGVVWRRADYCPFPERPFVFHPVSPLGLGSGIYDLTLTEATGMLR